MISMTKLAVLAGATLALGAVATSASAGTGCNGHIEQQTWGCAAWDNNNGPQFKYWKGAPAAAAQPVAPATLAPNAALVNRNGSGLAATGGGNLVATGGGNLVATGGGNLVATGGGNLKGK